MSGSSAAGAGSGGNCPRAAHAVSQGRVPQHLTDFEKDRRNKNMELFSLGGGGITKEELIGLRLYTGPVSRTPFTPCRAAPPTAAVPQLARLLIDSRRRRM